MCTVHNCHVFNEVSSAGVGLKVHMRVTGGPDLNLMPAIEIFQNASISFPIAGVDHSQPYYVQIQPDRVGESKIVNGIFIEPRLISVIPGR